AGAQGRRDGVVALQVAGLESSFRRNPLGARSDQGRAGGGQIGSDERLGAARLGSAAAAPELEDPGIRCVSDELSLRVLETLAEGRQLLLKELTRIARSGEAPFDARRYEFIDP